MGLFNRLYLDLTKTNTLHSLGRETLIPYFVFCLLDHLTASQANKLCGLKEGKVQQSRNLLSQPVWAVFDNRTLVLRQQPTPWCLQAPSQKGQSGHLLSYLLRKYQKWNRGQIQGKWCSRLLSSSTMWVSAVTVVLMVALEHAVHAIVASFQQRSENVCLRIQIAWY